jgi:hypothetical protein
LRHTGPDRPRASSSVAALDLDQSRHDRGVD